MISIGHIWGLFKEAASRWVEDRAPSMGAALAYYTAFSLAPLLIIVIAIAGLVFGQEAAQGAIMDQIQGLLGEEGGQAIQSMLANASDLGTGITATVIGFAALILGATTAFYPAGQQVSINPLLSSLFATVSPYHARSWRQWYMGPYQQGVDADSGARAHAGFRFYRRSHFRIAFPGPDRKRRSGTQRHYGGARPDTLEPQSCGPVVKS